MALNNKTIASLREDYKSKKLLIQDINPDPFLQFGQWLEEALQSSVKEPNAMTLATVDRAGRPSARILLLKGFDKNGFVFFTNYESKKGVELAENPNVAIVFLWKELERQVRIEGKAKKITQKESTEYFQSRPKGSQIGAWASPQSQVIQNRIVLEQNVRDLQEKYKERDVLPKPPHWGGYIVKPSMIEFWQGRTSRLHDRICFTKKGKNWKITRLAP